MSVLTFGFPAQERLKKEFSKALDVAGFERISLGRENGVLRDKTSEMSDINYETLRQGDIIADMASGDIDFGVVGQDVADEYIFSQSAEVPFMTAARLGIAQCSFWFAAKSENPINDISELRGKRIATSYPSLLQNALSRGGLDIRDIALILREGKVERAVARGLADVAFDIVETGGSLLDNDLEPRLTKMSESYASVVHRKTLDAEQSAVVRAMSQRLAAAAPLVKLHWPEKFTSRVWDSAQVQSQPMLSAG